MDWVQMTWVNRNALKILEKEKEKLLVLDLIYNHLCNVLSQCILLSSGKLYFGDKSYGNRIVPMGLGGPGGGRLTVNARHVDIDGHISANGLTPDSRFNTGAGMTVWHWQIDKIDKGSIWLSLWYNKGPLYNAVFHGCMDVIFHMKIWCTFWTKSGKKYTANPTFPSVNWDKGDAYCIDFLI